MQPRVKEALQILGYTEEWIAAGVVTEEVLINQLDEYDRSEDKNAEHYRAWGFEKYLDNIDGVSDQDIENIFRLKDAGPDNCDLHDNRIVGLILSEKLTDTQLKELERYPEVHDAPIQKSYTRSKAIRSLDKYGLTLDNFQMLKDSADSALHEFALDMDSLTREHLLWLSKNGLNKRVRNISKQKLQSKFYRE